MIPNSYDTFLMVLTLHREARNQTDAAKRGVLWVIRNRVENPCWWGRDVYSVLTKPYQFTSMSVVKDPNLVKYPPPSEVGLLSAIVFEVWDSSSIDPTGGATHYHDKSIAKPLGWGASILETCRIGAFTFYRQT
jgi:hypothetical protein